MAPVIEHADPLLPIAEWSETWERADTRLSRNILEALDAFMATGGAIGPYLYRMGRVIWAERIGPFTVLALTAAVGLIYREHVYRHNYTYRTGCTTTEQRHRRAMAIAQEGGRALRRDVALWELLKRKPVPPPEAAWVWPVPQSRPSAAGNVISFREAQRRRQKGDDT
jgi:hypothetical protein